jgi:uncharacterized membrane protein (DUF2068 family)
MPGANKRPPTLWVIIIYKLVKGILLVLLGAGVLHLRDRNLPAFLLKILHWAHLNVESRVIVRLMEKVRMITPRGYEWIATGAMVSGSLHLLEAIGLWLRQAWGGWLAIIQSLLFIPIEIYDLRRKFSYELLSLMVINIFVVIYLYANRRRLFAHHGAAKGKDSGPKKKKSPAKD